jgi:hypothetical protein
VSPGARTYMWRGYEPALVTKRLAITDGWRRRRAAAAMARACGGSTSPIARRWSGKDPAFYRPTFPEVADDLPYVLPV